jgi:hypothetical protein
MHDASAMRGGEGVGNLDPESECLLDRQGAACLPLQSIGEGFSVDQLHHQKRVAVLFPDVVQRADVGMGELRDGARLGLQALAQGRIAAKAGDRSLMATVRSSLVSRAR